MKIQTRVVGLFQAIVVGGCRSRWVGFNAFTTKGVWGSVEVREERGARAYPTPAT